MSFAKRNMLGKQFSGPFPAASQRLTNVFYQSFHTAYCTAQIFFEPALGRMLFTGIDNTGAGFGNEYTGRLTFEDAYVDTTSIHKGFTFVLIDGWPLADHPVAEGWHIRFRQDGSNVLGTIRDQSDTAVGTGTWFTWNQTYQIRNFRPSGGQLNVYYLVDFSQDGGVTTAFTIQFWVRSSSI